MIVIGGEFADQNDGNKQSGADHRRDKIPWLVFNSGKAGEYTKANHGTDLHPGDIHLSILKRLGMGITEFGSQTHHTNRRGNKLIF